MLQSILQDVEFQVAKALTAAGGPDTVESDTVDMVGYDNLAFIFSPTVIATGGIATAKVYASADDSTYVALPTAVKANSGDSAAGKAIIINVVNVPPSYRYFKLYVARTVAAVTLSPIIAMKYNGKSAPAVQGATIDGSVEVACPAIA